MSGRPRLLLVSPIMPATYGNGLAMRAAMSLRALSQHYRVSLLILPLYSSPAQRRPEPRLAELCDEIHVMPHRLKSLETGSSTPGPIAGPFDVIHVFRLASLPTASRWFETAGAVHLDLDDVESVSRPRIAALYREHGRTKEAAAEEQAAQMALSAEIEALMYFDRVYVCSEEDREQLPFCGSAEVRILPNVVDIPSCPATPPETDKPFTFLFVGNLSYFPNQEGLDYFAASVLPVLRKLAPRPFRIKIAGFGASPAIHRLADLPEIEVVGPVSDIAPWYTAADAVIAPIRAGGGTRIKVLEAFAFRRAVVTTTAGVEGIAARHQEHVLIADQPAEFAAACRLLMVDAAMRNQLVDRAFQLVSGAYSPASMVTAVAPGFPDSRPR